MSETQPDAEYWVKITGDEIDMLLDAIDAARKFVPDQHWWMMALQKKIMNASPAKSPYPHNSTYGKTEARLQFCESAIQAVSERVRVLEERENQIETIPTENTIICKWEDGSSLYMGGNSKDQYYFVCSKCGTQSGNVYSSQVEVFRATGRHFLRVHALDEPEFLG